MFDLATLNISYLKESYLKQHKYLDWAATVSKTKEKQIFFNTKEYGRTKYWEHAFHKNLEFRLFQKESENEKSHKRLKGSIHKFHNNGKHNGGDFNLKMIEETFSELHKRFGIRKNTKLMALEIGLNIPVLFNVDEFISLCKFQYSKSLPFKRFDFKENKNRKKSKGGNEVKIERHEVEIKIYNKTAQLGLSGKQILRFELKFIKSRPLKRLGIKTIGDLLIPSNWAIFKKLILKHFDAIFIFDKSLLECSAEDKQKIKNFLILEYWLDELKPIDEKLASYEKLLVKYNANQKKILRQDIIKKIDQLLCPLTSRGHNLKTVPKEQSGKIFPNKYYLDQELW